MKEWVSLVWLIRNWDITTCSLLDFLNAGLHSRKVGWIWKSLLWMLLLHYCCHFVWRNLLIFGFRSVYGILDLSGVRPVGYRSRSKKEFTCDVLPISKKLNSAVLCGHWMPSRGHAKCDDWDRCCVYVCEREREREKESKQSLLSAHLDNDGWLVSYVLRHTNPCRLFNAKSC